MKASTCLSFIVSAVCVCVVLISEGWSIPHCRTCPFDCEDLGLEEGDKDCSDMPDSGDACCVDLSKKGRDLALAQDDVNDVADEDEDEDEECPAGFEKSEQRCTAEERLEGCKDIRLDDGQGCVSR